MKLLYTFCWLMICSGILLIIGTLAYDILALDTLSIENARTADEVKRDTWLILTGAGTVACGALGGLIIGLFVKPSGHAKPDPEQAS